MYSNKHEEVNRPVKTLIAAMILMCMDLTLIGLTVRGILNYTSWSIIAIATQSIIYSMPLGGIGIILACLLLKNKSEKSYGIVSVPLLLISIPMLIYPLTLLSIAHFVAILIEY